ncbi:hypothetical protein [Paenibacillus amylolyticus]|uniref:hypothetical protein n=1 Tax=Paenibacillus amylolyticus TaxID=1451 RepID=UPI00201E29B7|nr:hypothetical protein [Paenibacillus amylolyticus]MCL6663482.1 hypothetical protein [Paenibacillus amylolyticus]
MTTLLQRSDIFRASVSPDLRPGRLRLTFFRGRVVGAVFTPVYLHAANRSCRKIVVGHVVQTGLAQRQRSIDSTALGLPGIKSVEKIGRN